MNFIAAIMLKKCISATTIHGQNRDHLLLLMKQFPTHTEKKMDGIHVERKLNRNKCRNKWQAAKRNK